MFPWGFWVLLLQSASTSGFWGHGLLLGSRYLPWWGFWCDVTGFWLGPELSTRELFPFCFPDLFAVSMVGVLSLGSKLDTIRNVAHVLAKRLWSWQVRGLSAGVYTGLAFILQITRMEYGHVPWGMLIPDKSNIFRMWNMILDLG